MEIIEQTSTKLVIIDNGFTFCCRIAWGIIGGLIYLPMGFFLVITNADSFFRAFILGVLCITPILILLANMLPTVNIFSFDKNLGYFQAKRWTPWKPYKIEEKEYLLETIDRVEIQSQRYGDDGERRVICLVLDEGRERVDVHIYMNEFDSIYKNEQQAEAIAKFLNVKNYGVISLPQ